MSRCRAVPARRRRDADAADGWEAGLTVDGRDGEAHGQGQGQVAALGFLLHTRNQPAPQGVELDLAQLEGG